MLGRVSRSQSLALYACFTLEKLGTYVSYFVRGHSLPGSVSQLLQRLVVRQLVELLSELLPVLCDHSLAGPLLGQMTTCWCRLQYSKSAHRVIGDYMPGPMHIPAGP